MPPGAGMGVLAGRRVGTAVESSLAGPRAVTPSHYTIQHLHT